MLRPYCKGHKTSGEYDEYLCKKATRIFNKVGLKGNYVGNENKIKDKIKHESA